MAIKQDKSYGVIPLRQTGEGTYEVLLINQKSFRGDVYWTFPKGHPEGNEAPEETALRELQEETGLVAALETAKTFVQSYTFIHGGDTIEKEVVYYPGWVRAGEVRVNPAEVVEAVWVDSTAAEKQLTHVAAKATLEEVQQYLIQH